MSHLVIKDESKPLLHGAINEDIYFSFNRYVVSDLVYELKDYYGFDLKTPYRDLPVEVKDAFLWGNDEINGLIEELRDLFYTTTSEEIKSKTARFLKEDICSACNGGRLKKEIHKKIAVAQDLIVQVHHKEFPGTF